MKKTGSKSGEQPPQRIKKNASGASAPPTTRQRVIWYSLLPLCEPTPQKSWRTSANSPNSTVGSTWL